MVLCASTYITVVLALERYKAVWRPVEYRNSVLSGDPWCRVFTYVAPVIVLSVLFNVPKVAHEKYFPRHINFTDINIITNPNYFMLSILIKYFVLFQRQVLRNGIRNSNHVQYGILGPSIESNRLCKSNHEYS